MISSRRILLFLMIIGSVVIPCQSLAAQTLIENVFTGTQPTLVGVNPASNRIYVVNWGDTPPDVTVLDGSNDQVLANVPLVGDPLSIAVNPITNRIYVVNGDANDNGDYTVTLIDGATNTAYPIIVGNYPWYVAVNTLTNKIYVTNYGDDTVTVIDGATNLVTATIRVRTGPGNIAINPATNRIYVCNWSENTVSVIDGATNTNIKTILLGNLGMPNGIVVNAVTNRVYATTYSDNTLWIIDGSSNTLMTNFQLSDTPGGEYQSPMAINPVTGLVYVATVDGNVTIVDGSNHILGTLPLPDNLDAEAIAIDSVTNKIYMPAGYDQLVMLDGNNNAVTNIQVGQAVAGVDVNPVTNRIYVANENSNDVSVVAGAPASPMQWYSVTPCRLADTRSSSPIQAGTSRTFLVPQLGNPNCGIPSTAAAFSLNVTVAPHGPLGYLTIWPTGQAQPYVSTMNSYDGRVKANAAIVPSGYSGGVDVFATNTTDVILDVDGYFAPASLNSAEFYPLTPCRVVDTRNPNGPLGGPHMNANQVREFPVLQSTCFNGVNNPQAYSFNVTVAPNPAGHPLGYLTIWPAGATQPYVSTLNNPTAAVVANGAIVPAGTNGDINVYTIDSTDVIIDVNGYFAAPGVGGLSMYPLAPCRVYDSRLSGGILQGQRTINVAGSVCAPPAQAKGYVFNATVVPTGFLDYLTLWPDSEQIPFVSTLNAYDGWIASNMAIVPNVNGSTDAYASQSTHLILDISGYFAPLPEGR